MCKIDGCENKNKTREWCGKHYQRWLRYGDVNFVKQERHGYRYHSLYKVWQDIKDRCYNSINKAYKNYGGRGIAMCDEWMNPKTFIEWALPLWKDGLQIDRKDNDGDYAPENCHFATPKENNHNQRLLRSTNTSGYRGVSYNQKVWLSRICINGKQKHIGRFDTPELAAHAYDSAIPDNRPRNFA